MFWVSFIAVFIVSAIGLPPPTYIKPCSISKDFEKCSLQVGKHALASFARGDKKYGIPPLDPFNFKLLEINSGTLKITLTDIVAMGLSTADFTGMKIIVPTKRVKMGLKLNHLSLTGQYEMNGKILVLPIQGKGPFQLHFYNGTYEYSYDLKQEVRDKITYAEIANDDLEIDIKSAKINFENLFNGDKVLGDETNRFLNENFEEVFKDLDQALKQSISSVCRLVLQNFFKRIPYKDLFLE
ncbi:unnamed protein product [Brassicogethes aeneus]|uniref:Protein takeout n=1 Tax=Brassicogethes aeneus TaxID=1431903 RepID=A0A9P0B1C5_BRAAE|nr:unnamed protein product [Brassicogethes aeneus]